MDKPWKVFLVFGGVFLAGVIFGVALAPRWFEYGRPPLPDRPVRGIGTAMMLKRLTAQLDLTPEQQAKIEPILKRVTAETREMRRESIQKFRTAMEKANNEIAAELTPEQKVKLEELRKRFRERIDRFRSEMRERLGPGADHGGPEHRGPAHPDPDRDEPPPPPDDGK